jgi:SAM-dependent methyltransferase
LEQRKVHDHMSQAPDPNDVRDFFDRQQLDNTYSSLKSMTRELDLQAAQMLNSSVHGDVLSVGGVWDFFERSDSVTSLTVMDLSDAMLGTYAPEGATRVVGDLYEQEFPTDSFDTVVFTLMLHHTPQGTWHESEGRIDDAFRRARRWLRPGGHVFILECCPHPAWMLLERVMLPFTIRFLRAFHQPPVAMYSKAFYEERLAACFGSAHAVRIEARDFNYWKWYPIFMSIRWLRVPFIIYPKPHVISAQVAP